MKKALRAIAALSVVAALAACSVPPDRAIRALSALGITNIRLDDPDPMSCGRDDSLSTTFSGTGVNGQPVAGVVCAGSFKGATVRFD